MSSQERGICCFCNEECNPHSQACGRCMRSGPPFIYDENIQNNDEHENTQNNEEMKNTQNNDEHENTEEMKNDEKGELLSRIMDLSLDERLDLFSFFCLKCGEFDNKYSSPDIRGCKCEKD